MINFKSLAFVAGYFFVFILGASSCKNKFTKNESNKDSLVLLTVKAIQENNGWGYEIFADNKLYIKQDIVPQIPGNHYFLTKEDAEKVANLVLEKLKRNQSPSISTTELQKTGAKYN